MHRMYAWYLARHKWFVLLGGLRVDAPLWRLLIHDWSKFLPDEWIPYATYFYAPEPSGAPHGPFDRPNKEANKQNIMAARAVAFDRAWLKHQHRQPHHWQHHLLREDSGVTKVLPIPEPLVREMVADWMGAGRAITGTWDTREWYEKNYDRIVLDDSARFLVDQILSRACPQCGSSMRPRQRYCNTCLGKG